MTKLSDALQNTIFETLAHISKEHNNEIYVIGGYVRDFLLGKKCNDIDIVTVGNGVQLAKKFAELTGVEEVITYENFGTALVKIKDFQVEFVGARKESYRKDSRKPIIENGTLVDDQLRRDFTINALSISLNPHDYATLYDPFNGISDLRNKILKTPTDPEVTFSDDPLRMIRAIRFSSQLNFYIEENTFEAIKKLKKRIEIISKERISEELNKIMLSPAPSIGFILLLKSELLEIVFPEFFRMLGIEIKNGIGHKDNFFHTLKVLDKVAALTDNLWLRWAALLHDIGKPSTKRFDPTHGWTFQGHEEKGAKIVPQIFNRLRLPQNEKMKYVQKLVRIHQRPIALVDTEVTDSAIRRLIYDAGADLYDLLILCRCDITTKDQSKLERYLQNYDLLEKRIHEVEVRDQLRNWQPPITGEIIMDYFKITPSPLVGKIKNAVRDAILDGVIKNDYESAFTFMLKIGQEEGICSDTN